MRRVRFLVRIFLLSLTLLFMQCSLVRFSNQRQSRYQNIQREVKFLISDPVLANAHIGIYIESLKDGHIIFQNNPFKLMVPASNMKLFTSAAALVNLGPQYRFSTQILASVPPEDSVLAGDLIIRGSGDPSISGRFYHHNPLFVFENWADSLKHLGIKVVRGDLVGDNRYFKEPSLGEGWDWDDEPYWYAARTSALSFNDNCLDFTVWPDPNSGQVHFTVSPALDSLTIINQAVVGDSSSDSTLSITRLNGKNVYVIKGIMPVTADTAHESITVENPARFFLRTLYKVLNSKGIKIQGKINVVHNDDEWHWNNTTPLFVHQSPPLFKLIEVLNKVSHNFYAEQFLKTMGATFEKEGSFKAGCHFVKNWLESIGIAPSYFLNVDGSGLSRKNFVAPIATAILLKTLYHHPYFNYFYNSLPIAGVEGTIRKRMRGTLAQGNVRAKTGFVQHMRALSGYVNIGKDDPMIFVMMFNNYSVPTSMVNKIQDHICELLSE